MFNLASLTSLLYSIISITTGNYSYKDPGMDMMEVFFNPPDFLFTYHGISS